MTGPLPLPTRNPGALITAVGGVPSCRITLHVNSRAAKIRAAGVRVVHVRVRPAGGQLGDGGTALSVITTTLFVSSWGKKDQIARAPARDTAKTSRGELSLLLARPKSEPPTCESFTCACVPPGGD